MKLGFGACAKNITYERNNAVTNENITKLYKELPTKEFAVAMAVIPFVSEDGTLKYNGKNVDGVQMCELLDDTYRTFKRILHNLCLKGVLGRVRVKSEYSYCIDYRLWVVNPFLYGLSDAKDEIVAYFKDK